MKYIIDGERELLNLQLELESQERKHDLTQVSYVVYEEDYFAGTRQEYNEKQEEISGLSATRDMHKRFFEVLVLNHYGVTNENGEDKIKLAHDVLDQLNEGMKEKEIKQIIGDYVDDVNEALPSVNMYLKYKEDINEKLTVINNHSGRLVGIYKNNGELTEDGYNKNLLGFAYLPDAELDTSGEDHKKTISNIVNLAQFGAGSLIKPNAFLQGAKEIMHISDHLDELVKYTKDEYINNNLNNIAAKIGKINDSRKILNEKITELEATGELKSLTPDEQKEINAMKWFAGAIATVMMVSTPQTLAWQLASFSISAGIDFLKSAYEDMISKADGRSEYFRYQGMVKDGDDIPFPASPEYLSPNEDDSFVTLSKGFNSAIADATITNKVKGNSKNNSIKAIAGDKNHLIGEGGDDALVGYDMRDTLEGGIGSDVLEGKKGTDILKGGSGADIYVYNDGDGKDVIEDKNLYDNTIENNKLVLKGINKDDVRFEFNSEKMTATMIFKEDESNKVVLKDAGGFFVTYDGNITKNTNISEIQFADTNETIDLNQWIFMGSDNGDISVHANEHNNQLYGFDHNDTFFGEKGDDYLEGGHGSDTYVYNLGDGKDLIKEVKSETDKNKIVITGTQDVTIREAEEDLIVTVGKTAQNLGSIRVEDGATENLIDKIQISEGTNHLHFGLKGFDEFENFSTTNDKYIFRAGDGEDVIHDYVKTRRNGEEFITNAGQDELVIAGYAKDQVNFAIEGDDLIVSFSGESSDRIVIKEYMAASYLGGSGLIEKLRFVEKSSSGVDPNAGDVIYIGEYLSVANSNEAVLEGTASGEYLLGREGNDTINGNGGNDIINGHSGKDILRGQEGEDTLKGGLNIDHLYGDIGDDQLYGDEGNDYLYGGSGNDHLYGGENQDVIHGGSGNDTYYFRYGDGNDIINEGSSDIDTIVFEDVKSIDDLSYAKTDDLVIYYGDNSVRITDYFLDDKNKVEKIRIGDEEYLIKDQLVSYSFNEVFGTNSDDKYIREWNANTNSYDTKSPGIRGISGRRNNLYGLNGDDDLIGMELDDRLYGGQGDDTLKGKGGEDTYYFEGNFGEDIIYDAVSGGQNKIHFTDLNKEELYIWKDSKDLVLEDKKNRNNRVIINDFYSNETYNKNMFDDIIFNKENQRVEFESVVDRAVDVKVLKKFSVLKNQPNLNLSDYLDGDVVNLHVEKEKLVYRDYLDILQEYDSNENIEIEFYHNAAVFYRDGQMIDVGYNLHTLKFNENTDSETSEHYSFETYTPLVAVSGNAGTIIESFSKAKNIENPVQDLLDGKLDDFEKKESNEGNEGPSSNDPIYFTKPTSYYYGHVNFPKSQIKVVVERDVTKKYKSAETVQTPIILDLNGDGIQTTSINNIAYFDHQDDGFKEKTGWLSREDGLLVRDIDGNGLIESGRELFGNNTYLENGSKASDGFEALAALDKNGDGVIDSGDENFGELKIWKDANGDGNSQENELHKLSEFDIIRLNLQNTLKNETDENGNILFMKGTYVKTDGSIHEMSDYKFKANMFDTVSTSEKEYDAFEDLPNLSGVSHVVSLHEAMNDDDELLEKVEAFVKKPSRSNVNEKLQEIFFRWMGVNEIDPNSRACPYGHYMDARKVKVLELVLNDKYVNVYNQSTVRPEAAKLLISAYDSIFDVFKSRMIQEGPLKDILNTINFTHSDTERRRAYDFEETGDYLTQMMETDPEKAYVKLQLLGEFASQHDILMDSAYIELVDALIEYDYCFGDLFDEPVIYMKQVLYNGDIREGSPQNDEINGTVDRDFLFGYNGDDILSGNDGNDILDGGTGSDKLYGGSGDDEIIGGSGNDHLEGHYGSDTYKFNLGDGMDTILENGVKGLNTKDKIVFGEGITPESLVLKKSSNDLIIKIKGYEDQICVKNYYSTSDSYRYKIEALEFSDGTVWDKEKIESHPVEGTSGDDTYKGTNSNDHFNGLEGADTVYGYGGNDTLNGGADDDTLYGNDGNDILDGGTGSDTLYGGSGDDEIIGGSGNDHLEGHYGSDTYKFNLGDGMDTILEFDGSNSNAKDKIVFGEGITPESLVLKKSSSDLIIKIKGYEDQICVKNYYSTSDSYRYKIEALEFSDGTVWDKEKIESHPVEGTSGDDTYKGTNSNDHFNGLEGADAVYGYGGNDTLNGGVDEDTLYGYGGNDLLNGGADDDTLYGNDGNDILDGGTGSDTLYGGSGDDVLIGGSGNDHLEGHYGSDTYKFNLGDGMDTILEFDGSNSNAKDKIVFGEGITPESLVLKKSSSDLIIKIKGYEDQICVKNYYSTSDSYRYKIEALEFSDGTVWDKEKIESHPVEGTSGDDTYKGTNSNDHFNGLEGADTVYGYGGNDTLNGGADDDTLYGNDGNDILDGGTGSDTLYGGSGDDVLIGGSGNDELEGHYGSDTYKFNLGDGMDTILEFDGSNSNAKDKIVFGEGITPESLVLKKSSSDLIIKIKGYEDQICVKNYYSTSDSYRYKIEALEFSDGTVWDKEKIESHPVEGTSGDDTYKGTNSNDHFNGLEGADTVYGYGGNDTLNGGADDDTLYGNDGNDILDGGTGSDTLYGGSGDDVLIGGLGDDELEGHYGSDTYKFNLGDGMDTILEFDGSNSNAKDKIVFGEGITPESLVLKKSSSDLIIKIKGYEDQICVKNYYSTSDSYRYKIEALEFSDGTVWDKEKIESHPVEGTSGDDTYKGTNSNDHFNGLEGADTVYGYGGNDTLNGGVDEDTLYGYGGNDLLNGGADDDTLYGNDGNDILDGGTGSDTLYGGSGDDVLIGGSGNDHLEGHYGSDTYKFNLGDGMDTILEFDGSNSNAKDKIVFGEGITPESLVLKKSSSDLIIKIKGYEDQICVKNYYSTSDSYRYKIEALEFSDGTVWDKEKIESHPVEGTSGDDTYKGTNSNDHFNGLEGADTVYGYGGNDTLNGGADDDTLYGNDGNDILDGGTGSDTLYGGSGDDVLIGGSGNDELEGHYGSDTYKFNLGDGMDTILEFDGSNSNAKDKIVFGEGITPESLVLKKSSSDLIIKIKGYEDQICVKNYYSTTKSYRYKIEALEFSDGTVWDKEKIESHPVEGTSGDDTYKGTNSNDHFNGLEGADTVCGYGGNDTLNGGADDDTLYGNDGNDILEGGTGSDKLYGGSGDDEIIGGSGNDHLEGSYGSDTYKFNLGDGMDTILEFDGSNSNAKDKIVFGEGITPESLVLKKSSSDLIIKIKGHTDQICVKSYYSTSYSYRYKIETLEFSDGTVWDKEKIESHPVEGTSGNDTYKGTNSNDHFNGLEGADTVYGYGGSDTLNGGADDDTLYGNEGNDTLTGGLGADMLYGWSGDDILIGGSGNDHLEGSYGSDTYKFNLGDGMDTILEFDGSNSNAKDKIVFGEGITPESLVLKKSSSDLIIKIKGHTDQICVKSYYSTSYSYRYKIETLEFSDGTVWDKEKIESHPVEGTSGDDTYKGTNSNDHFNGLEGADTLYGNDGNDTLNGGADDDILYGYDGNDVLIGGSGDDELEGHYGSDTYKFNLGDGMDTILEFDGSSSNAKDKIVFGEGITPESLVLKKSSSDLIIKIKGHTDQICVKSYYSTSYSYRYKIETLEFSDGTVWDKEKIESHPVEGTSGNDTYKGTNSNDHFNGLEGADTVYGYGGSDTLNGGADDDTLYGNEGNDTLTGGLGADMLYGWSGDDILIGGSGNDHLEGSYGSDTYKFNLGDGMDTILEFDGSNSNAKDKIVFGEGITPESLVLKKSSSDLIIKIKGHTDQICVKSYYSTSYSYRYKIETLEFSDGTVWDKEKIESHPVEGTSGNDTYKGTNSNDHFNGLEGADTVYGYGGNDTLNGGADDDTLYGNEGNDTLTGGLGADMLYGWSGDDILIGGSGNDHLEGSYGHDTYKFDLGDGMDTILEYDDSISNAKDKIVFGEGITPESLVLKKSSSDLIIKIKGHTDQICVKNYYSTTKSYRYKIEALEFSDGTVWDKEKIESHPVEGTSGNDTYKGTNSNDHFNGLEGADTVYGYGGNDTLNGGADDDTLYGNEGNDTLTGGLGADMLYGWSGDDILIGGSGNDHLEGSYGHDTYKFDLGDGMDTILEYDDSISNAKDKIVFGEGITPESLVLKKSSSDLIIKIKGHTDQICVKNYYSTTKSYRYKIEALEFSDGTVWDKEKIESHPVEGTSGNDTYKGTNSNDHFNGLEGADTVYGYGGSDTLNGGADDDTLYGNEGNDTLTGGLGADMLYGWSGDDILIGGSGNDHLEGSYGHDTYIFKGAFGKDIVSDTEGSNTLDIRKNINDFMFSKSQDSLIIEDFNNTNSIEIKGSDSSFEPIKFNNGISLEMSKIDLLIQSMNEFCETNGIGNWESALESKRDDVEQIISSYVTTV
ncbi:calcium-binding protein [Fusibacter sp. JL216-2]|uniref:calcium-binding protein n=1 Tax=Fusibacter sp. JL216-2 TaxID=3071453 RepID=UPI003D33D167